MEYWSESFETCLAFQCYWESQARWLPKERYDCSNCYSALDRWLRVVAHVRGRTAPGR